MHGTEHEVKEGEWRGHVVVIAFPSIAEAQAWWDSPAYRRIAPLRARHVPGDIILVSGVSENYDPSGLANAVRHEATAQR